MATQTRTHTRVHTHTYTYTRAPEFSDSLGAGQLAPFRSTVGNDMMATRRLQDESSGVLGRKVGVAQMNKNNEWVWTGYPMLVLRNCVGVGKAFACDRYRWYM
jgi:hypothetical protein